MNIEYPDENPYLSENPPSARRVNEDNENEDNSSKSLLNVAQLSCCAPLAALVSGCMTTVLRTNPSGSQLPMERSDRLMAGMWHFILPIIAIGVAGFVIATSPRTARKVRRTGWFSIIINVAYLVLAGVLVATAVAQIQRAAG